MSGPPDTALRRTPAAAPARLLTAAQERWLRTLRWRVPLMMGIGLALVLAFAAYGIWAAERLRTTPAAEERDAFDAPLGRLAALAQADDARLRDTGAATERERVLMTELRARNDTVGRLLVAQARMSIALLGLGAGAILVAAGLAQRPLLRLVNALRRADAAAPSSRASSGA